MQIKVQKVIVEPLELGEYHKAYAGQCVQVWVNPPSEKRRKFSELRERIVEIDEARKTPPQIDKHDLLTPVPQVQVERGERAAETWAEKLEKESAELLEEIDRWLSEIWSQGADETHMSSAEIKQLRDETREIDPLLFSWLVNASRRRMLEYLGAVKKA
jgi:hypothetical protein